MIEPYRGEFNARFTDAMYTRLLQLLDERVGTHVEFRIAETPCFFPQSLMQKMMQAGVELTTQLLANQGYMEESDRAIPAEWRVPNQSKRPHFMTVDFGLVRDAAGELQPKLVEMQAFPSIFGYQPLLAKTYIEVFNLDRELQYLFNGLTEDAYWGLMREVIIGEHEAENVVLAEVSPQRQKTLPDFLMTEKALGIKTVDVALLIKEGNKLFYRDERRGRLVPIERIYNRAIVDELVRENTSLPFDYRDELQVEWAGHPNWYYKISKFALPHLQHETVPAAVFLDDWYAGRGHERLPQGREQWVLKPLYSFAGKGITFAPSEAELRAIPARERRQYLLQERVHFQPVIETPEGKTQAEVRILYVWPDGKEMVPMTSLVRMGRGLMMGVDHNRDRTWVGGSAGLIPPGLSAAEADKPRETDLQ